MKKGQNTRYEKSYFQTKGNMSLWDMLHSGNKHKNAKNIARKKKRKK